MDSILNQIEELHMTPQQCDEFLKETNIILENKKTKNNIDWLIKTYHIDKSFYCLTNAIKTSIEQMDSMTWFSIEYPTRHDPSGWETEVIIKIQNNVIVEVYYDTDRYVSYNYIDRHLFPYGSFQGECLKSFYQHDQIRFQSIQSDIAEINELCRYLF